VQITTVLACDDLEADGDALEAVIELPNLDQLGFASLAAVRAPQVFGPTGSNHGASMRAGPKGCLFNLGHCQILF
jgi:hypothetical protein